MANLFGNYTNKTCVVILKLVEVYVTILVTPLLLVNYSIRTQFI